MTSSTAYTSPRYLHRHQVDAERWNNRVETAPNGLAYAQTVFLDHMCPGWGALVLGNYDHIMPLPQRQKGGISYLFQPFQIPMLGIIGDNAAIQTDAFLAAIPRRFRLLDLSLNPANHPITFHPHLIARQNLVLPLIANHTEIKKGYTENLSRTIGKAEKATLVVKRAIPCSDVLALCRSNYPTFMKVARGDLERVEGLLPLLGQQVLTYGVYEGKDLLASAIFLQFKNRISYWLVGNQPRGRQVGASALLLDAFIADHAGTGCVLDFEGSDVPGVAAFYRSFGAQPEHYTTLYCNRLPFPFSLLKKMPAYYRQIVNDVKQTR